MTMIQKNNPTKKYLIISSCVFVITTLIFFFFLFLINLEKEKVENLSNELTIAKKEDVVALKRAIRSYEESADNVKSLLVDKDKVFDFISDVEQLARDSGADVTVENIDLFDVLSNKELVRNTGQENPERTHGKFVMSLKVEGSWEAVSSFLLKMENFPKHTIIESVKFNSVFNAQNRTQRWSVNFNIITTTN